VVVGREHTFDAGDGLETIGALVEGVVAEDRSGWSTAAHGDRVVGLAGVVERARAGLVLALGPFLAEGGHRLDGSRGAVSWVAARCGVSREEAVGLVRAARLAWRHELVAESLAAGQVRVVRVVRLARAVRGPGRWVLFGRDEHVLVEAARSIGADVDFEGVVRAWEAQVDDELDRAAPAVRHARRGLTLSDTTGGAHLHGFLPADAAAVVRTALDDLAPPDPVDGSAPAGRRSRAQRRADALVELATRHLAGRNHAAGAPVATVDVVVRAERLAAHLAGGRPDPPTLHDLAHPACTLDGQPVALRVVERFWCDTWIGRLVVNGPCEPLDVGRRQRSFTAAQRRAVVARDRHCRYPGCDIDAAWCDLHHLHPWHTGGATDLANAVLVCHHHHTWLHHHQHTLHHQPDGTWTIRSP
jgi:hypothetical protein